MKRFELCNREGAVAIAVIFGKLGLQLRAHLFRSDLAVAISVQHLRHASAHRAHNAHHAAAHHVAMHALHHIHHSIHALHHAHHAGGTSLRGTGSGFSAVSVVGLRERGTAKDGCSEGHCSE